MSKYLTSPLVFFENTTQKPILFNGLNQKHFSTVSDAIYEILWYFIEPHTIDEAIKKGISRQVIEICVENKLLIVENDKEHQGADLWESHNWSRAAFLTFSQLNLRYIDKPMSEDSLLKTINNRRILIQEYENLSKYPKRYRPSTYMKKMKIPFDVGNNPPKLNLNSIKGRNCVRKFLEKDIPQESFYKILAESTHNIRRAEASRADGDPFFILNSFYTWTVLYVLIQGVEGFERGIYHLDPETMELSLVRVGINDQEIWSCIQGQKWIQGGGFCVFVGVDWERYAWIYRHSRAYINLLIQIGEISEEFILSAYAQSLKGWMTPAVTETRANELCQIKNNNVDIMYFLKFGHAFHEG